MRNALPFTLIVLAISMSSAFAAKTESKLTGKASGVIMLDAGTPLVGAKVTLIPAAHIHRRDVTKYSTVSVEGGRFNIGVTAGKYVLRVSKDGVPTRERRLEVREGETTEITVRMDQKEDKKDKKD